MLSFLFHFIFPSHSLLSFSSTLSALLLFNALHQQQRLHRPDLIAFQVIQLTDLICGRIKFLCDIPQSIATLHHIADNSRHILYLFPVQRIFLNVLHHRLLLLVQDGYKGVCLDKVEPERTIKLVAETGKVFPLHAAACGKILLAYAQHNLQNYVLESELESYTPFTITSPAALKLEIEKIRAEVKAVSGISYDK